MRNYFYILLTALLILSSCDDKEIITPEEDQKVKTLLAGDYIGDNIFYEVIDYIDFDITRNENSAYLYGGSANIDLRHDFNFDLKIEVQSIGLFEDYSTSCYFRLYDNIEICLAENDTSNIKLYTVGDTINSEGNWYSTLEKEYYLANYYFKSENSVVLVDSINGLWNDAIDGYMAIRETNANDTTYGWIRLDLTGHYKLLIKDYAIQK